MKNKRYGRSVFPFCSKRIYWLLVVFVIGAISGCPQRTPPPASIPTPAPATPTPTPVPQPKTILRLHGSRTIAAKLIPDMAEAFLKMKGIEHIDRQVEADKITVQGIEAETASPQTIEILSHNVSMAFRNVAAGICDVVLASRRIEKEDIQSVAFSGDLTAPENEHVVALDGIAILVNKGNPVDTLSKEQIIQIFSGDIEDWSQVDGEAGQINVYALDNSSGTYEAFQQLALGNSPLTPRAVRVTSGPVLSDQVDGDRNGIGFVRLAHIEDSKVIAVTIGEFLSMQPDPMNVATENYPLSYRLYLYLGSNSENPVAREFVDFALSQVGQQIVAQHGFVNLNITLGPQPSGDDRSRDQTYKKITKDAEQFLLNIRFRDDSTHPDNKALRDLDRIVEFLGRHEQYNERGIALLEFWDDPRNTQPYNEELTLQHAQSVEQEFLARDLKPSVIAGFGEAIPDTEEVKNRRVEVWLIDPDRNSGTNSMPSGATEIPLGGSDPGGSASYDKGDRTDWYRVIVRGQGGTLTYRVQQYQGQQRWEQETTLGVEVYYTPRTYRELDDDNPLETFFLHDEDKGSYTIEDAKPGVYYAKVFAKNPGDESSYKISNTFEPAEGFKPTPTPPTEVPTPIPKPSVHKPVITILSPEPTSITTEDSVLITGEVKSDNTILQIQIDGESIPLTGEERMSADNRHIREFSYRVNVSIGENVFVIAAWDEFGNIGTVEIRIVRE